MKSIFFLSDPLTGVTDFEKVAAIRTLSEMEIEARSRTLVENQKDYQDITFKLLTLNRWFYFGSFFIGLFWLPVVLLLIYGMTQRMINFLSVMLLVFILSHFIIYERPIRKKEKLISFLKDYRRMLKKIIYQQLGGSK